MWLLVRCGTESKCCNPSLIIGSSACRSLQMCHCIPIVTYLLFFYSWLCSHYSISSFSEELNVKSGISTDLNTEYNFHVLTELVETQYMVHGVSTMNSGCLFLHDCSYWKATLEVCFSSKQVSFICLCRLNQMKSMKHVTSGLSFL